MPALITHDYFGRHAQALIADSLGSTKDCTDAFLLGNQGPDPLFYLVGDARYSAWEPLGSTFHRQKTEEVLVAMKQAINVVPVKDRDVARAYALGFLCHYLLDSAVHPLVYAQQNALCDAGVAGLTRENADAVHATIEREFDEVVLTTKLNTKVRDYRPVSHTLKASESVLKTISAMYLYAALTVFNQTIPDDLFARGTKLFRSAQVIFYSKNGIKRAIIVRLEELVKAFSSFAPFSMRTEPREESFFENRAHDTWTDPATGEPRTQSLWDLYDGAMARVEASVATFLQEGFSVADAETITNGLEFNGMPVGGVIVKVED